MLPASADRWEATSRGLDVLLVLVWIADFAALFWIPITKQNVYMGPLLAWAAISLAASALLILANLCLVASLYLRRKPHAHRTALLLLAAVAVSVLLILAQGPIVHRALQASS
jgi:hypothetical protein